MVRNNSGATITKGTVVYINGASGNNPTIAKAIATGDSTSAQTFGLVQADITNNSNGYVVVTGDLIGVNTSAITEGSQLYLSSTTAGAYTTTKQLAPAHLVYIGVVTRSHASLGQIEVKIQNGYELDELHDVAISSKANNEVIVYESSTDLWKNKSIATILGYIPANDASVVKLTGDQSITGQKTFTNNTIASSINVNNTSTGKGIILDNSSTGTGIYLTNSSTGTGIRTINSSSSSGIYATNSSIGEAIRCDNSSTGIAIYSNNSSSGKNLVLNNTPTATGMPFTVKKDGTDVFTINDAGGVYAAGSVGIGTSSPSYKLDVNGDISLSNGSYYKVGSVNLVNDTQYIPKATTLGYFVNSLLYDNGTNVGIGTESPAQKLHVVGNGLVEGVVLYRNGATNILNIGGDQNMYGGTNSDGGVFVYGNNKLHLSTNSVRRLTIDGSGNVGIGTVTPTAKLTISGTGIGAAIDWNNTTATTGRNFRWVSINAGGFAIEDITASAERMRITSGGSVGIGMSSPAVKLVVDGGSSDYTPIWAKSSLLASSKYYSSLLAGYALTANQSAQFGYVYDTVTATNSYAHITPFGASEGSKFMVRADGNVGIGTISPNETLTLYKSDRPYLQFVSATTGTAVTDGTALGFTTAAGEFQIKNKEAQAVTISTSDTERMRITSAGNVGINTTSITSKLQVVGLPSYADNTTALAGGLTVGAFYHTAGVLKVVI